MDHPSVRHRIDNAYGIIEQARLQDARRLARWRHRIEAQAPCALANFLRRAFRQHLALV